MSEDYRAVSRPSWDERAPAHATSPDYGVERFEADPAFVSDVVHFDLPRLGSAFEHDSVPRDAFPEHMERIDGGELRLADRSWRLPHSYTLQAVLDR